MDNTALTEHSDAQAASLLGLTSAALLTHFQSLAADARLGTSVPETLELARHASTRFAALDRALAALTDHGSSPEAGLGAFTEALGQFHRHTAPQTWPQVLLKCVLVCGFATDFEGAVSEHLPPALRAQFSSLVAEAQALAWWARQSLESLVDADPEVVHSLGLFGRRVLAEGSAQAQRVAGQDSSLAALCTGSVPGSLEELSASVQLIADLVEASAQRMVALGLQP
ncbi:ferritin-like fold-containing protein [Aestuariimicrobium ganziense]|uniref:ferritin-like fold-containing protein n=1 Tax=Aestuariimicrobium ganziense TaxID=2773677 RepID=UPI0019446789|nr:ferritin-like fold-containing protein [Aestuariimicrobium ganziense]